MSPLAPSGSIVVCDPDDMILPGRFVIAKLAGADEVVFRKFRSRIEGGVTVADLVPLNENYPSYLGVPYDGLSTLYKASRLIKRI